jgi:hypothetical protein
MSAKEPMPVRKSFSNDTELSLGPLGPYFPKHHLLDSLRFGDLTSPFLFPASLFRLRFSLLLPSLSFSASPAAVAVAVAVAASVTVAVTVDFACQ